MRSRRMDSPRFGISPGVDLSTNSVVRVFGVVVDVAIIAAVNGIGTKLNTSFGSISTQLK